MNDLETAKNKILTAISNQRWFFFENKPNVLMDKSTGILWANLDTFPYNKGYTRPEAREFLKNYSIDGFKNWLIPYDEQIKDIVKDKSFPFKLDNCIKNEQFWVIEHDGFKGIINLYNFKLLSYHSSGNLLPYNNYLIDKIKTMSTGANFFNAKGKTQFTLELFIKNNLIPIFYDDEITKLYKQLYLKKSLVSIKETKNDLNTVKNKILDAIKNQRWFSFENKPNVLIDKLTGILWANLKSFPFRGPYDRGYTKSEANRLLKNFEIDGFKNWIIPAIGELKFIVKDKSFPFLEGVRYYIKREEHWLVSSLSDNTIISLFDFQLLNNINGKLLPCNYLFTNYKDYAKQITSIFHNQKEKTQLTLNLFIENKLIPIFNDKEITKLYKQVYIENSLVSINKIKQQSITPITFDYAALLSKYNSSDVDKSIIKYYQTVQQWINELMNNVDDIEKQKKSIISNFNSIGLKLSKKFVNDPNLTVEENTLIKKRQKFLQSNLSLGTNIVKQQLLSVRQQADEIEKRLNNINNRLVSFKEMAKLEKEERPSFAFIAENTANIMKNTLKKIEYFEANSQFVTTAINIWEQWTEDYKIFKTKDREELKNNAEYDGIDESIWQSWYADWQKLRFNIEEKIQPALARGLKGDIPTEKENEITVIEQLIRCLEMYKDDIDKFYLEERKGIYQKYAFVPGGELQDKFETESELYKCTAKFQSDLQEIIFSCTKTADRMFILQWAENLLDIQIDEIISFVADRDLQQVSREVLQSFSQLKQKNYDAYLNDVKAYSQEKANREKQYNSLMFKMRSELNKQK